MLMIFGICLIVGALADIFLTSFAFGHLLFIALGSVLLAVGYLGDKLPYLKGAGKTVLSLVLLFFFTFWAFTGTDVDEGIDRETEKLIEEAEILYEEEGIEKAEKLIEDKLVDLGWNRHLAIRGAELYEEEGMLHESAVAYGNVLRQVPDDLDLRMTYAKALFKNDDYNGAFNEASYIIRIDPEYADAYMLIGDLYRVWNDHFREQYYYKIAVGLDEESIVYRLRLAEAYSSIHSYEASVMAYEKAKALARSPEESAMVYESYLKTSEEDQEGQEELR